MESTKAKIARLERTIEKYHQQHKNLKKKVTQLARRLRVIEPFAYAEDRDLFYLYVQDFIKAVDERKDRCRSS